MTLSDGTYLDVTDNHKWLVKNRFQKDYKEVTTLDLLNYDGKYKQYTPPYVIGETKSTVDVLNSYFYTLGFTFGDGSYDSKRDVVAYTLFGEKQQLELEGDYVNSYSNKNGTLYDYCEWVDNKGLLKLKNTTSEIDIFKYVSMASDDKILSFISGLADADGSNTNSGGIRIYISKYQNANYLYLLLQKCGFKSSINLMAKKGDITNKGIRSEDIYYIQVTDCQGLPTQRLDTSKGHKPTCKGKNQLINSVVKLEGTYTTYCVTEPIHHTCVFNGSLTKQCNLGEVHLNQLDPKDLESIRDVFYTAGQSVASLLVHEFDIEKFRYSREIDPIVGVSFTGLFDFFVNNFGVEWLKWFAEGRPNTEIGKHYKKTEADYLTMFRELADQGVKDYCEANGLKVPNRCTTVQPAGTKSLLTGASPGWHPPKAARYIRRITFAKNDPVALACIDYGYNVVPAQKDTDENGVLLNDPFDSRCTEWLVEIPVETSWANMEGCDQIDINQFSAAAQYDFYMQVQTYYTAHNCFSGDTEFLTSEGYRTFDSYEPGQKTTVLNKNGQWVEAEVVQTNDERDLYEINLVQGSTGKEYSITTTECHRWPTRRVSGGNSAIKIKTTSELKPGDRLVTNSVRDLIYLDSVGVQNGLVYGDGSVHTHKKDNPAQLYLCGDKRELRQYLGSTSIVERDDLNQTRIYDLPEFLKYLPDTTSEQEYLAGFFAGLLATDGNISKSTISISSADYTCIEFLEEICPKIGVVITSVTEYTAKSGYKVGSKYWEVKFSKETLWEELILRPKHLAEFKSKNSQPRQWKVESIIKLEEKDYGWCVMEPETEHFTLKNNILTMNTSATLEFREDEIDELAKLLYNNMQNGEGYISAALLARFDANETFPRLPFEPVSKEKFEELSAEVISRRESEDFHELLLKYDTAIKQEEGPAGCDSSACLMPEFAATPEEDDSEVRFIFEEVN